MPTGSSPTCSADRAFRDRLRRRFDALEAERSAKAAQLDALTAQRAAEPEQDPDLLDALPIVAGINITEAPERIQRKLYDALQLQISYERPDQAHFRITLTDDTADMLAHSVGADAATCAHSTATPPSRSTCASTTFALLNHGVVLRLCTRFEPPQGHEPAPQPGQDEQDECRTKPAGPKRPGRADEPAHAAAAKPAEPASMTAAHSSGPRRALDA